jgi:hypothetical protein
MVSAILLSDIRHQQKMCSMNGKIGGRCDDVQQKAAAC